MSFRRNVVVSVSTTLGLLALGAMFVYWRHPAALVALGRCAARRSAGLESITVEAGGRRWPYLDNGRVDRETLVLLHGFGMDKDFWGEVPKRLARDYRMVIPDLPGFGESSKVDDEYGLPRQADRLDEFLRALKLERVHLVGCSMGGAIAVRYAVSHPERVRTLSLIDPFGAAKVVSDFDRLWQSGENPFLFRTPEEFDRMTPYVFLHPQYVPGRIKAWIAEQAARDHYFHRKLFDDMVENGTAPLVDVLPKVSVPTLIVWGKQDRTIDVSAAEAFREGIRNSRVALIEDAGHVAYIDQPSAVTQAMGAFLHEHRQIGDGNGAIGRSTPNAAPRGTSKQGRVDR